MTPASTAQMAMALASSFVPASRSSRRLPNNHTAAITPIAIISPYRLRLSGPMSIELNDGLGMLASMISPP